MGAAAMDDLDIETPGVEAAAEKVADDEGDEDKA